MRIESKLYKKKSYKKIQAQSICILSNKPEFCKFNGVQEAIASLFFLEQKCSNIGAHMKKRAATNTYAGLTPCVIYLLVNVLRIEVESPRQSHRLKRRCHHLLRLNKLERSRRNQNKCVRCFSHLCFVLLNSQWVSFIGCIFAGDDFCIVHFN